MEVKPKEQPKITDVLFVDQTPGGNLAKRLREVEERLSGLTGFKIKIVERGGKKLKTFFPYTNPWAGYPCGRVNCIPCKQKNKKPVDCFRRNVMYKSYCLDCKDQNKGGVDVYRYVGETGRSLS